MKKLFSMGLALFLCAGIFIACQDNPVVTESENQSESESEVQWTGYILPGTYAEDCDGGQTLILGEKTITDFDGLEYEIIDSAEWNQNKKKDAPLRVAYLVKRNSKKYLCSVWYYVNNEKDYIKFERPVESNLSKCPETYDSKKSECETGEKSGELKKDLSWSVQFQTDEGKTLTVEKAGPGKVVTVSFDNKKWPVKFSTLVKNTSLSMPAEGERMEMDVEEGLWLSSSNESPSKIHDDTSLIEYPLIAPYTAFYELQCIKFSGMYALSVTQGHLEYEEDDYYEEEKEYIDYSIVCNIILTESQYEELMIHFR